LKKIRESKYLKSFFNSKILFKYVCEFEDTLLRINREQKIVNKKSILYLIEIKILSSFAI
jgi:hypothetical protein